MSDMGFDYETRVDKLVSFFTKVDRIISSRALEVQAVKNVPVGATTSRRILINTSLFVDFLSNPTFGSYIALKGVNYHELAHNLFTGKVADDIIFNSVKYRMFNVLEDARVESIFSILYSKAKKYFKYTFLKFVQIGNNPISDFFLVYSRRFILDNPEKVAVCENEFVKKVGEEKVKIIKSLINGYLVEWDIKKREKIVKDIIDLLNDELGTEKARKTIEDFSVLTGKIDEGSSQPNNQIQKKLSNKLDKELKKIDKKVDEKVTENEAKTEEKGDEKESSKEEESKDVENEGDIENELEIIEVELADDVESDWQSAFGGSGTGGWRGEELKTISGGYELSPRARTFQTHFTYELKDIKKQKDYDWLKGRSGKLNLKRLIALETEKDMKIFKKWKVETLNKFKADIVVAIDVSGSMERWESLLRDFILGLGNALKKVNMGDYALTLFSDYYGVIKKLGSKQVNHNVTYSLQSSGTMFKDCLNFIKNQFRKSKNPNKILFIFSDGLVFDYSYWNKDLEKLVKKGIEVFLVYPTPIDENHGLPRGWKKDFGEYKNFHFVETDAYERVEKFAPLIRKLILGVVMKS